VRSGDSVYLGIFDTRANISSISASYARKLGIRLLNVSYDEGSGITGQRFKCTLGVADSFRIDNILMKNVVFQVMPDEVLYIAPIDLSLPIIIGYPVIAQWREMHIHRDGTMTIPAQSHPSDLRNMALDGLDPVVKAIVDGDTLGFKFDTGATTSDIFDNYFRRHKDDIMRRGRASKIKLGGAGGVVEKDVYTVANFTIRIGSKTATLKEVSVHKDPIPNLNERFYGNLGQDLMAQFDEMILNFQDMYVDFK
ncbi:MAG TPA: retropepsin-like aspartic protease, partial [Puia sp.]